MPRQYRLRYIFPGRRSGLQTRLDLELHYLHHHLLSFFDPIFCLDFGEHHSCTSRDYISKKQFLGVNYMSSKNLDGLDLAPYIEHTLLDPVATESAIAECCTQAEQWKFPLVCIAPIWVKFAVEFLHHKRTKICTVIGFPTGAHSSATKLYEAQEAVDQGAAEIDVVINLGWLKAGNSEAVYQDIAAICDGTGIPVKAILETAMLTTEEKKLAAEICLDAGVAFLKTSTGWRGGATVEDIKLLRSLAGDLVGVKASGGIRTTGQALDLIAAGATRLGTSRGIDLIQNRDRLKREDTGY